MENENNRDITVILDTIVGILSFFGFITAIVLLAVGCSGRKKYNDMCETTCFNDENATSRDNTECRPGIYTNTIAK